METGTKGRILFLQKLLLDHTDDNHSFTMEELIRICEENGYKVTRHTISNDIFTLNEQGIEIISERRGNSTVYHIGTRLFELAELKMLVDAVSSARFITKAKSNTLIDKLTKLTNEENRSSLTARIFTVDQIKTTNPRVLQTIDTICTAIDSEKKISFHYISYTPEKARVLRNEGHNYIVSPYALIWNDDRYYLAAQYKEEKSVVTFRIDRIHDVVDDTFSPSEYANRTVLMFDGGTNEQLVTLCCDNKVMQNVIDRFGEEIETCIIDDNNFSAKVMVRPSRTFFSWVFGFCGEIRISSPESIKLEYEKILRDVLSNQIGNDTL